MDTCFPDWSNEVGVESPVAVQRKSLGLHNELVELLWQNGELVLNNQNSRKQSYDPYKSKQVHKYDQSTTNQNSLIQDDETVTWIDCPIDESFEKEFCADFLSEIPSFDPLEANKPSIKPNGEKVFKFGASEVNHVGSSQQPDFAPPPRFQTGFSREKHGGVHELSGMTIGSSHCASNQVVYDSGIGNRTMSEETYGRKVSPQNESTERETIGQALTSCSGGSGSSFWKTSSLSNDTNRFKRKTRDAEESECISDDATEMESGSRNKSSQKPGTTRRSRVAEVHNMSERKRRDRINEKMRALQELIPHSNKTDKASMLDEAIDYMKSLQLQIQLMWMGRGMAPMMLPRVGMGIGPPIFPTLQNLMHMSRLPVVNQAIAMASMQNQAQVGHSPMSNQNQMQNSGFLENYAGYMGYHSMPNTSQPTNMFNFGAQQNQVLAPQDKRNGSTG